MKAKVLTIVLLVAGALATPAFARGAKDDAAPPAGPAAPGWRAPGVSQTKTEVTGKLSFDDWHPTLKTDKEEYALMVPGRYRYDIDVKEGDTIKAEGYLVENAPWCADDNEKGLLVTKAVVNGKEYEIDQRGWGPGAMGPGGRGRPYGYGGMRGRGMMGGNWGPGPRGWR
jgi:hypothetical protein